MSSDVETHLATRSELERAVFRIAFSSRTQRLRRFQALSLFGIKHALRGLLFFWPAYAACIAVALHAIGQIYLVIALPAVAVSMTILVRALRVDYRQHLRNRLVGSPFSLVFGSDSDSANLS